VFQVSMVFVMYQWRFCVYASRVFQVSMVTLERFWVYTSSGYSHVAIVYLFCCPWSSLCCMSHGTLCVVFLQPMVICFSQRLIFMCGHISVSRWFQMIFSRLKWDPLWRFCIRIKSSKREFYVLTIGRPNLQL
jgi:hypothetical protein